MVCFKFLFFSFLCFVTGSVFSADRLNICNDCFTYLDFERTAASGRVLNNDVVKVLNAKTGEIRKFRLNIEIEPGIGVLIYKDSIAVTAAEYEYAQQAKQGLSNILDFFDSHKNVPEPYAPSALNLIGNSQKINHVSTYYNQTITSGQVWNLYWGSIISLGGVITGVNFVADFYFSDGSKAVMRLSGISAPSSGQVFVFDLLEVWDSSGNKVPINKTEFEQRANDIFYAASAEVMSGLLNVAERYNIFSLQFSRESFGGGGRVSITECRVASDCKIREL